MSGCQIAANSTKESKREQQARIRVRSLGSSRGMRSQYPLIIHRTFRPSPPPVKIVGCLLKMGINFSNIVMQDSKADRVQWVAGVIFLLSAAAYMIGPWVSLSWLQYFKVVPLVVVLLLLLRGPRREHTGIVVVGLIFGILGDLVLQHGGEDLFALGAGLFLINHIFYNLYFLSLWRNRDGEGLFHRRAIAFLACIIFISASSINLLTSFSDETKQDNGILVFLLPVYMVVLDMTALNPIFLMLSERTIQPAAIYLVLGGISYFLSDNLLGMSKFGGVLFLGETRVNSFFIMTTYYIAQYFIPLSLKQRNGWTQEEDLEKSLLTEQHHE